MGSAEHIPPFYRRMRRETIFMHYIPESEIRMTPQQPTTVRTHRDFIGSCVGIAAFLGGMALLVLVFRLAYEMFITPPSKILGFDGAKKVDLNASFNSMITVFLRILLLLVMGLVGSWIANRGISLYTHARGIKVHVDEHVG